jgi:hypothetical protein
MSRNRTSARLVGEIPGLHDNLMENPMMQYSSNRYGTVDRMAMGDESRTNSLTAAKLDELQGVSGGGPYPAAANPRRVSQSPAAHQYGMGGPGGPGQQNRLRRPSPPNQHNNSYGPGYHNRPSPPNGVRQPIPRYPPGQGNSVAPQQVEQHAGVSKHHLLASQPPLPPPPKVHGPAGGDGDGKGARPNVRSLTGSASASAGSGDSSGVPDSTDTSAHSSQDNLPVTRVTAESRRQMGMRGGGMRGGGGQLPAAPIGVM